MKANFFTLVAVILLGGISTSAFAEPVSVSSYDITGVRDNKNGYYTGEVSQTGPYTFDYTGGSGTINDGQIAHSTKDAYLFHYTYMPTLTLHLGEMTSVAFLELFSFEASGVNTFTGSIAGVNVTINGETRFITSEGFGPLNYNGSRNVHERLSLIGSGLEDLITDTITLSGFVADANGVPNNGFYLSQINVDGTPYSGGTVSEPAGLALLAGGLAGLGMIRRRKNTAK